MTSHSIPARHTAVAAIAAGVCAAAIAGTGHCWQDASKDQRQNEFDDQDGQYEGKRNCTAADFLPAPCEHL